MCVYEDSAKNNIISFYSTAYFGFPRNDFLHRPIAYDISSSVQRAQRIKSIASVLSQWSRSHSVSSEQSLRGA